MPVLKTKNIRTKAAELTNKTSSYFDCSMADGVRHYSRGQWDLTMESHLAFVLQLLEPLIFLGMQWICKKKNGKGFFWSFVLPYQMQATYSWLWKNYNIRNMTNWVTPMEEWISNGFLFLLLLCDVWYIKSWFFSGKKFF